MRCLLRLCEQDARNRLDNAVLERWVLKSEASAVEEVCDLLTDLEEVLDVNEHGHTEFLHLDYIFLSEHHTTSNIVVLS